MESYVIKALHADLLPVVPCDIVKTHFQHRGLFSEGMSEGDIFKKRQQIKDAAALYQNLYLSIDSYVSVCQV